MLSYYYYFCYVVHIYSLCYRLYVLCSVPVQCVVRSVSQTLKIFFLDNVPTSLSHTVVGGLLEDLAGVIFRMPDWTVCDQRFLFNVVAVIFIANSSRLLC